MHPQLVEALLEEEVERVRADDLLNKRVTVERDKTRLLVRARREGQDVLLAFDGPNYNAEPLGLSVVDAAGEPLAGSAWPGGLNSGDHPALHRPFSCLLGLYEYHVHLSHLDDSWDKHRNEMDFPTLLRHVLAKAGCS